jgi:hypothetical protein
MARDWSRAALDDLAFHTDVLPTPGSAAVGLPHMDSRGYLRQLGLAALCLLTGAMAALLYGWPALMLTELLDVGPRPSIFWSILGGAGLVIGVVAFAITTREHRYWTRNLHSVSDWVTPPPWK